MSSARVILALGLSYFAWRVTQQRAEQWPAKIEQAFREIAVSVPTGKIPGVDLPAPIVNVTPPANFNLTALLDLIARGEANRGYDSYYALARRPPTKPVSQMSIAEVRAWQDANRAAGSVSTAIGRYQFIRDTFNNLVRQTRTARGAIFNAALQDAFAIRLMQPNLDAFRAGRMSADAFAHALSRVWASLPRDASNQSYYAGIVGNRAHITWAEILSILRG